jgi:hypothetical protein
MSRDITECGREESNLHPSRDRDLNPARLPVPPRPRGRLTCSFWTRPVATPRTLQPFCNPTASVACSEHERSDLRGRVVLHLGAHVLVDVRGDRCRCMAEALWDHLDIHAGGERHRGVRETQVVEPDAPQPCPGAVLLEPDRESLRVDGPPIGSRPAPAGPSRCGRQCRNNRDGLLGGCMTSPGMAA